MAGVTDYAFRTLCREFAPGLLYVSEMVTARALVEDSAKTMRYLPPPKEPAPRSVQLYGSAPGTMYEAVRRLIDQFDVAHIDLNFGCPVPKVTRKGGGAALPVRHRLYANIVDAAVRAASIDGVPLTVKFRVGVTDEITTYRSAGKLAEECGAAAVALHARTAEQRYSGTADWDRIADLKQIVTTIPVLGNGDIWRAADAVAMRDATGCDGVVVGRGCLGRPWIFAELAAALNGTAMPERMSLGNIVRVIDRHRELLVESVGEFNAMRVLRRHLGWYLQGYPVGDSVRQRMRMISSNAELDGVLGDIDPEVVQIEGTEAIPRGRTDGPQKVNLPEGWLDLVDDPTPPVGADIAHSGG